MVWILLSNVSSFLELQSRSLKSYFKQEYKRPLKLLQGDIISPEDVMPLLECVQRRGHLYSAAVAYQYLIRDVPVDCVKYSERVPFALLDKVFNRPVTELQAMFYEAYHKNIHITCDGYVHRASLQRLKRLLEPEPPKPKKKYQRKTVSKKAYAFSSR